MNAGTKKALLVAALAMAGHAGAEVTFYEHDNFQGRSVTVERPADDLSRSGFHDRASSVVVVGGRWELCEVANFGGRCIVLRPGHYPSLGAMDLNDRISSVRPVRRNVRVDDRRYAPVPYESANRGNEGLFEANVSEVRAVLGQAGQRCWIEREEYVVQNRGDANVGGAIAGALIGGILGHQVGGGVGKDVATVGGAVAGAAVGANVGRDNTGQQVGTRDVQRCADQPRSARPAYWDVTYSFRGVEHHAQMTAPPGATIVVNERGEPRTR